MKKLTLIFPLLLLLGCKSRPDLAKDGGERITVEVSLGQFLRESIYPNDSLALAIIDEAYRSGAENNILFLDTYFDKLEKAGHVKPALHFRDRGIPMGASTKEVLEFFRQKLQMNCKRVEVVLKERLDKFGAAANVIPSPNITRIVIEIAGKNDMERIRKLLQTSANLELWETWDNSEMYPLLAKLNTALAVVEEPGAEKEPANADPSALGTEAASGDSKNLNDQLAEADQQENHEREMHDQQMDDLSKANPVFVLLNPSIQYGASPSDVSLMPGPVVGYSRAKDTAKVNALLLKGYKLRIFPSYTKFLWTAKPRKRTDEEIYELLAVKGDRSGARVSGEVVTEAHVMSDHDSQMISMSMNKNAAEEWQKMTRENIGKSIAMVVDDEVYSYPNVTGEISGGSSSITGNFTMAEAEDLCNILEAGCLPVPLRIVAQELVAPVK
ncbi:MAG: SecDF P1 head subdomain-containing protein [Bacteroidia bacterium]